MPPTVSSLENNIQSRNYHIEPSTSKFKLSSFAADINNDTILFEVLKMKDSVFIWIGAKQSRSFRDLSVAVLQKDNKLPIKSKLIGSTEDSSNLAGRLSKKLNKLVYVSLNVQLSGCIATLPLIEKVLHVLISKNESNF